jgi:hypothetical protein
MPIKIAIISLSRILDDPRVRRQCELLQANGFEVFAIGEDDVRTERVSWTVVQHPTQVSAVDGKAIPSATKGDDACGSAAARFAKRLDALVKRLLGRSAVRFAYRLVIAAGAQLCRLQPSFADTIFWFWIRKADALYEKAKPLVARK